MEDGDWYLVRVLPYYVGPKAFSGVVITLIDITPLREAREKLKDSRRTAADIVQHMPSGLFVYKVSERGKLILESGNAAASEITGIDVGKAVGSCFTDLWAGEQGVRLYKAFIKAFNEGKPLYEPEVEYSDGNLDGVFNVHAFKLPGNRLAVSFEDITERKLMESDLRASEKKFRNLFETMAQGVVYQNAKGNILLANPSAEKILGLSLDQMLGRTSMDPDWQATKEDGTPLKGDDHPSMVALRTGKAVTGFIMGVRNPEFDKKRWILVNATPDFKDDEQIPYQVFTTFEDITERKRFEDKLSNNEQRLHGLYRLLSDAEETARMGSWTWDVATDTVTWSDNLFRLLGRDRKLGEPSFAKHDSLYTPESMARLRKAVNEALHKGTNYELRLEAVKTDGTIMPCVARGQTERNSDGVATRLFGSLQEIVS